MGPNTWVELETRGLLKGKAGPGAFGSGGRDSTAASSKEQSKSRKEFVAAAVEKAVRSGSRAKGAEAGGDSLQEQSRDVGVREKALFDRICKAQGARPVVLTSRKSAGAETGPALGECPRFVREPEGNAGEHGLNALWMVIQILGIVDWHFRIVMEGGEVWLRARRPGHEVAKFYHGTSVTCAQKIFREDAIRPGPRQSASGRKVPVAFMSKNWYNIESYVGPSKVPGHTTLIAQVIGGEAEGKSWKANNPNYRVALSWRPTSAWLRVWNAGSPTDAKRTWSYASAEYVWPHKKGQEPAPSSRALRSPERAEAESREDEPEAARGQRSGRPVDKEFLEALKAVEAGTFEGGKWQAWKEFRERDKLRARGQSATSAASTSTGRKRGSHGDTGKGLAKARDWACIKCKVTNHIVRVRCRGCAAWQPESVPEATREEFEQYENFMAKKIRKGKQNFMAKKIRKGKQKRKKRASGRAAASEQRGGSPSREPPDEPDRKRRRRAVIGAS